MAFSNLEKAMALIIGLDIAAPGFSRVAAKAAVRAIGPLATRAAPAAVAYNPVASGAALGLGALATPPGQDLLAMAEERGRMDRIRFEQALTDLTVGVKKRKARTKSKFNSMVSKGMKQIKISTKFGKKGNNQYSKESF